MRQVVRLRFVDMLVFGWFVDCVVRFADTLLSLANPSFAYRFSELILRTRSKQYLFCSASVTHLVIHNQAFSSLGFCLSTSAKSCFPFSMSPALILVTACSSGVNIELP